MTQHDCDVLVVGAGPVGTALALELALHGVSFRIIDRLPARNQNSRALVIQPRTLELLNRHGAADTIVRRGRILRGGSIYINQKFVAGFDLDDLGTTDTEFPLPLNISQAETEAFLDECLAKYSLAVERPVSATSIIQDADGVTTILLLPDGKTTQTVRSKYIIGCDGAHSAVRHASQKMTFPGAPYPQEFILCDVHLSDSSLPMHRLTLHLSATNILATFPISDQTVRVIASRSAHSSPSTTTTATTEETTDLPSLPSLQSFFTSITPPGSGTLSPPVWLARFRLHHRCVSRYRDARLFVAGDAAHIHSPAGGLGMNAGIQDAVNLGWKLALALSLQREGKGQAAEGVLDTYDLERRPVGVALLRGTDRLFSFVSDPSRWWVPVRNVVLRRVLPWATRSKARRGFVFRFISQLGVNYRGTSRIVGGEGGGGWWFGGGGGVKGGDRLLDGKVERCGGEGGETSLQRVCVGAPHHLLLFAGCGEGGKGVLDGVAERVVKACYAEVQVHYIAYGAEGPAGPDGEGEGEWYADVEGRLHGKFGFGKKAGYVLVRPDGYVAHIGPLANLDRFVLFLDGYLVSPEVAPRRSLVSFLSPVVWAAVGAALAIKLWGKIVRRS
ncbi:FAD binding domain-containing protein [Staphylotrichum tortipilum]|uniref:FAD binding domain-containing protein n=1 Tax=Staphylotrichum tortipilum TaxID=2831512 RepID=A0AAN6RU06_9PEZI|nr:FAD binding domain-containing protein [Staphylotrichum longicolle]